ncbi:MAG: adenylate kinase [Gammaproteobacteria bacterium]|nr:adenylate kinase [Gammaproteobacteria bacterium]|tara:strand:+ start:4194 stop:4829 length:636 start_codon:yes stop_codon:yes gene_type:complete
MNILFLGAPGCGKGTQSKIIIKKFGIPQISTGDLLREEIKSGSSLGEELQQIMSSGKFVSDELVLSLVSKKIEQDECKKGFILDGYPRNLTQAKNLDSLFKNKNIKLEYVFLIDVPFDVLIERCTGRLLCTTCDYIGNMDKGDRVGDKCEDGILYQREDDKTETVKNRLNVYQEQTAPIIDYYDKKSILHKMIGGNDPKALSNKIIKILEH